ncbi:pre-tRNA nuclear export protein, partial [Physocladia obscura]
MSPFALTSNTTITNKDAANNFNNSNNANSTSNNTDSEDEIELAMLAALDPQSPSHSAASEFCARLRERGAGWQPCLMLGLNAGRFVDLFRFDTHQGIYPSQQLRRAEARFVAFQVVEELLTCGAYAAELSISERTQLRQSVFSAVSSWISSTASRAELPPNFLRNKLLQILVLIMRNDYVPSAPNSTCEWPSFFLDFLALPRQSPVFAQIFLAFCFVFHDEIASREMLYSANLATQNILIKDAMRAQGIPAAFVQVWFLILSDSMQSNDSTTASAVLKCIGLFVSWIDSASLILSNSQFIDALLNFLNSNSPVRIGALNCLMGLVDKGMLVPDKLTVLDMLNATSRIPESLASATSSTLSSPAQISNEDEDFEDLASKYINLVGLELCRLWDTVTEESSGGGGGGGAIPVSAAIPRPTGSSTASQTVLKSRILKHCTYLLPHAVRILQSEYDDTSAIAFPFLDEFLRILKACKRDNAIAEFPDLFSDDAAYFCIGRIQVELWVDESLRGLLGVIIGKMKYDEDVDYDFGGSINLLNGGGPSDISDGSGGGAEDDEEALFYQLRLTLRSKMEVISGIDSEMFFSHFSRVLLTTFDTITSAGQYNKSMKEIIRWSDAELALHLLYIYKSNFLYVNAETGAPTPLNISAYPHPSIPLVFFELVVKYGVFYSHNQMYLPHVLEAFVDTRGCYNTSSAVRSRVYYLFLRFVKEIKEIKPKVKEFAVGLVEALGRVLYIAPPTNIGGKQTTAAGTSNGSIGSGGVGIFDNQLYVFEAVGFLISLVDDGNKQEQLLQFVLTPLMTSMQKILDTEMYKHDTPENMSVTNYLRQLITAVGSVGKGFPDFDAATKSAVCVSPLWATVFKRALHQIILVLQRLNGVEAIRDASTLHTANNPADSSSQKLALSLLSKMVAQWGSEASNPLCKAQSTLANSQREPKIQGQTPETTLITGLSHSALAPIVARWKPVFNAATSVSKADKKGTGGKEIVAIGLGALRPFPQFSQFIYNSIAPLLFEIPGHPQFNISDGAVQLVVFEIANLHKTILIVQGVEYLQVLEELLSSRMGWNTAAIREFEVAIVGLTTRELQVALKIILCDDTAKLKLVEEFIQDAFDIIQPKLNGSSLPNESVALESAV